MNEVSSKAEVAIDAISLFQEHFPIAFPDQQSKNILPLKKGIDKDLKEALAAKEIELSRRTIRLALARWCRRKSYVQAVIKKPNRTDLQGNSMELVSEDEKQFAKKQLSIIDSKNKNKKMSSKKVT